MVWAGSNGTAVSALAQGANYVGFAAVPPGYGAYQLLQAIGDETVVSSVRRFNAVTGRYESAGCNGPEPVGVNFPIERAVRIASSQSPTSCPSRCCDL